MFDEGHEKDLEESVNNFIESLMGQKEIIDIKYNVSVAINENEQIYCYSALVMYDDIRCETYKPKKYEIVEKVVE